MKHRISFYLAYGCLVLFGTLGVLLLALGNKEPRESETENRMLAGFPAFSLQSLGDGSFMAGLESYLSDGMPARDRIVTDTAVLMNALSLDRESRAEEELFEAIGALGDEEDLSAPIESPVPTTTASETEPPEQTETPAPQATDAPEEHDTPQPTPAVEQTPAPTDAPAAAQTVKACTLRQIRADGTFRSVYSFPKENMQKAVNAINAYRAVLPEDGRLFFTQVPFPSIAFGLQNGTYVGWDSDVEQTIQENALPGVEVVSALEVLEPHLLAGEDLYFHTDHHWKPRAACCVAQAMLKRLGIDAPDYDAYSYYQYTGFYGSLVNGHPELKSTTEPDTIEVLIPTLPVVGHTISWSGKETPCPFIVTDRHNYLAYLGGTLGPWRRYDTGVDNGRKCLVIGDSYICCFTPYLAPYYEEVHTVDFRTDYYDGKNAKWTVTQYIQEHGIDDVYLVLSTASGVNSSFVLQLMQKYL